MAKKGGPQMVLIVLASYFRFIFIRSINCFQQAVAAIQDDGGGGAQGAQMGTFILILIS